MKEKYEKKDKNSKENSKLIKAFPKLKRRDPKMSLKKIQTENQNETKEIFLKNEREKWDFIIC